MKSLNQVIKISSALILLTLVISISSCKKSGVSPSTGSNVSQASFGVISDSSPANAVAAGSFKSLNSVASAPLITWTAGIANVAKFEFEATKNGIEKSFETRNLTNVDLFALNPSFASTTIDTGTYREIEVKIILASSSTGAIPLMLQGQFTTSNGNIPVEFDFNQSAEIKAKAENVVVSGTQNLKTIFLLHLSMLSSGITAADLDLATQTGGKVVISNTSNTTLFNKIIANLGNSGEIRMKKENKDGSDDDHGDHSGHGGNENDG